VELKVTKYNNLVVFFTLNFDFEPLEQIFVFKNYVVGSDPDPQWMILWIQIRFELKCWIRIRIESIRNLNPGAEHDPEKHGLRSKGLLTKKNFICRFPYLFMKSTQYPPYSMCARSNIGRTIGALMEWTHAIHIQSCL
jgi:hypothetical protein